jgi:serine/threonine protein kinase
MEMVGSSTSALVLKIDDSCVIKVNKPEMTKTEHKAYRLFETVGESLYILKCIDYNHPQGLIFERLDSRSIAERLLEERFLCAITIPWARQLALGLEYLHKNEIIHADLTCRNLLVDEDGNLKIIDFAGSSVHGSKAVSCCGVHSRFRTRGPRTVKDDIFAYGSSVYHLGTGTLPYAEKSDSEVAVLFEKGKFLTVKGIFAEKWVGVIIMKCWRQEYTAVSEIIKDIDMYTKMDPE